MFWCSQISGFKSPITMRALKGSQVRANAITQNITILII